MKAIGYFKNRPIDDANSLVDIDVARPEPQSRDLIVKVQAISVNPADVKIRSSSMPTGGEARILGYDAVGTVEATGPEVKLFHVGDEVFYAGAIDRPGTYAEYHAVDERLVGRKPKSLNAAQAAALPLTSLTAWELLFDRLKVPYGKQPSTDAILIINGTGGVGSILTQIASSLTGLTVIATASRPETVVWAKTMGAHQVINHHNPLDEGLAQIGIPQVRYIAGLTASDQHQEAILQSLKPQGALAMIDDPATFDIAPFKSKSLSVHWELMFTRSLYQTPDMIEQHRILNEVSALIDNGVIKTTLCENYGTINAANLKRAHAKLESGRGMGKIVLEGF